MVDKTLMRLVKNLRRCLQIMRINMLRQQIALVFSMNI